MALSKPKARLKSKSKSITKPKSLRSGRPPILNSATTTTTTTSTNTSLPTTTPSTSHSKSQSSKHTRTLIRQHHNLHKQLARAKAANDATKIAALESQLAASGGLKSYQLASTIGQSKTRGGDSSRVLVEWLREDIEARKRRANHSLKGTPTTTTTSMNATSGDKSASSPAAVPASGTLGRQQRRPLYILEIGALSTTNALNIANATLVRRIDLRSSGPGIEECDFMAFPIPSSSSPGVAGAWHGRRGYDVLSLSLVLNYVPDAKGRGDMLRRTTRFFSTEEEKEDSTSSSSSSSSKNLPCLFLVLPAPCLHNSRYLTPAHLVDMMASLGYTLLQTKTTAKLYYSLWRWDGKRMSEVGDGRDKAVNNSSSKSGGSMGRGGAGRGGRGRKLVFRKREINPGVARNNFCIVLEGNGDGDGDGDGVKDGES